MARGAGGGGMCPGDRVLASRPGMVRRRHLGGPCHHGEGDLSPMAAAVDRDRGRAPLHRGLAAARSRGAGRRGHILGIRCRPNRHLRQRPVWQRRERRGDRSWPCGSVRTGLAWRSWRRKAACSSGAMGVLRAYDVGSPLSRRTAVVPVTMPGRQSQDLLAIAEDGAVAADRRPGCRWTASGGPPRSPRAPGWANRARRSGWRRHSGGRRPDRSDEPLLPWRAGR